MKTHSFHSAALATLTISLPIYASVERAPAYLGDRADVAMLVCVLSVALPGIFVLLQRALESGIPRQAPAAAGSLVGLAAALGLVSILARLVVLPPALVVVPAAAGGVVVAVIYARLAVVRMVCTALTASLVAVPALFLASSSIRPLWLPSPAPQHERVARPVPVVVVLFDELSLAALLEEGLTLDAERYPGFARLASTSTWFRRATSVADDTVYAVPALLAGLRPRGVQPPTFAAYPTNLFTLLGPTHLFRVDERWTRLCPPAMCAPSSGQFWQRQVSRLADLGALYAHVVTPRDWAHRWLPPLSGRWEGFGAAAIGLESARATLERGDAEAFTRACRSAAAGGPPLCFLHLSLPHTPWEYLPSGRRYGTFDQWWLPHGVTDGSWIDDEWLVVQGWQRYLLQTAYADRVLGRIIDALERDVLFDRAIVVVAADHGVSFRPGGRFRWLDGSNLLDLAAVPLFIKRPGQRSGDISDDNAEIIDVFPTVADLLGATIPTPVDGRSLFGQQAARDRKVFASDAGLVDVDVPATLGGLDAIVAAQRRWFGSGDSPGLLFRAGPRPDLLDRPTPTGAPVSGLRVDIESASHFLSVDLDSGYLPARVVGRLTGPGALPGRHLAIGLNGLIRATTETSRDGHVIRFSAMVPEEAFLHGVNRLEVLEIAEDGSSLLPIPALSWERFSWAGGLVGGDGRVIPAATGFRGQLERVEQLYQGLSIRGWANASPTDGPIIAVAVFRDDELLYVGHPIHYRTDVSTPGGLPPVGVEVRLPLRSGIVDPSTVRVFAVTASRSAGELARPR
jgi:hypothetical protein